MYRLSLDHRSSYTTARYSYYLEYCHASVSAVNKVARIRNRIHEGIDNLGYTAQGRKPFENPPLTAVAP